jgi:hypothetical protein
MTRRSTRPRASMRRRKQHQMLRETYVTEAAMLKPELVPAIRLGLINEDEVTPVAAYALAQGAVEREDDNGKMRLFGYLDVRIYTVPNGTSREWPE